MTERLSISMPDDVAAKVRKAAEDSGLSVSVWMVNAAEAQSDNERRIAEGLAATREYEAEYGEFTDEEMAQAREELIAAGVLRVVNDDERRAS